TSIRDVHSLRGVPLESRERVAPGVGKTERTRPATRGAQGKRLTSPRSALSGLNNENRLRMGAALTEPDTTWAPENTTIPCLCSLFVLVLFSYPGTEQKEGTGCPD